MEALGIVSLGLQVCGGLLKYYESWKDCGKDVAATHESLSGLEKTFNLLKTTIKDQVLSQDIIGHVEQSIVSCEDGIKSLKKRLDKVWASKIPAGLPAKVYRRALYPFKESTLAKMREAVQDLRGNLALSLSALQIDMHASSHTTLNTMSKQVESVSLIQEDDNRQKILDWLSGADDGAQHSDYISGRQSGTGQWLLDSSEFREWLHGTRSTIFCPGIPGSGKTMMAAIVVDHLLSQLSGPASVPSHRTAIAFLYCNYRKHETQKAINLLSSVLKQLCASRSRIPESVKAIYEQHSRLGTRPSLDEISKSLHSVVQAQPRVIVIIDALDECREDDGTRTRVLSEIRKLQSHSELKLMATSRDIPDIAQEFQTDIKLEVLASDADVTRYLDGQMPRLSKCVQRNDGLKQKIRTDIVRSAKGMFLLAKLHMESLQDKITEKLVNKALESLPRGLEALNQSYDQAIERIDGQLPEYRLLAKRVISWITHARRPLTTQELQHALAVEPETFELDTTNLGDIDDIISVCAGLVTVDYESNIVRLVHYTTQHYFELVKGNWMPNATEMIASTCLTYLSYETFNGGPCSTDEDLQTRLSDHILFDYSAHYWGSHVQPIQNEMKDQTLLFLQQASLILCCTQIIYLPKWQFDRYSQNFPEEVTALHLASQFNLQEIMATLLEDTVSTDATDSHNRTPLSWAAEHGSEEVVKLLITRGDVNVNSTDRYGDTPLHHAIRRGHENTVKMLLMSNDIPIDKGGLTLGETMWTRKIDIDLRNFIGRTPLSYAAERGSLTIMKLLLMTRNDDVDSKVGSRRKSLTCTEEYEHEAVMKPSLTRNDVDVDSKDNDGRTPLSWAADKGHETIVRCLINRDDVDADSKDKNDITPLSWAARNGHEMIVQILTQRDDVNADSQARFFDQTPLSWAARNGHEMIVQILAQRDDVNADSKDGAFGQTPLSWAAYRGHETIVRYLINRDDVDADLKDFFNRTPLSWAAEYGQETIVDLLIERDDVDANSKDVDDKTPLSWAAASGQEKVVKRLLAREDVDPDSKDVNGRTSLSCAAEYGQETIVDLLIKRDVVDADSKDGAGKTPLSWAAASGQEKVVKMLLARDDVDADSKDDVGRTPLSWAAEYGQETIVDLLIERDDVDANSKDGAGKTPLSWAAASGREEVVKMLLARDDVDADSKDGVGRTPLSWAAVLEAEWQKMLTGSAIA